MTNARSRFGGWAGTARISEHVAANRFTDKRGLLASPILPSNCTGQRILVPYTKNRKRCDRVHASDVSGSDIRFEFFVRTCTRSLCISLSHRYYGIVTRSIMHTVREPAPRYCCARFTILPLKTRSAQPYAITCYNFSVLQPTVNVMRAMHNRR